MPDVGLFTAAEKLSPKSTVVIKYSVEVEGLPVYQESYDSAKLAEEIEEDEARVAEIWLRRIKCVVACRNRPGFSACLTRCLMDGVCGDLGHVNPTRLDQAGEER